jgi:hypothetical protein
MIPEELRERLLSKRSADRRSAAKHIAKEQLTSLSETLFTAYTKEKNDRRTWETQVEMIKAIGKLNYRPAFSEIATIVQQNLPHDTITIFAARAYVQLTRTSLNDGKPVLQLLISGGLSVATGALMALSTDRMVPERDDCKDIIRACWDINQHPDRIGHEYGFGDPRNYLAAACAGWEIQLTAGFLHHCISTAFHTSLSGKRVENKALMDICKRSLSGKYTKLD